jgi:phosphatidate phosphatase PAH1
LENKSFYFNYFLTIFSLTDLCSKINKGRKKIYIENNRKKIEKEVKRSKKRENDKNKPMKILKIQFITAKKIGWLR